MIDMVLVLALFIQTVLKYNLDQPMHAQCLLLDNLLGNLAIEEGCLLKGCCEGE